MALNNMKNISIYMLEFPNNKVYIGQTNNFSRRMSYYKNIDIKYSNRYLYNAIKKYEWNNIKREILLDCNAECSDFFERAFISGYNSTDKQFGYNLDSGGNKNKIMSDESRQKMRDINLGKKKSDEVKRKISEKNSGKNHHMYGRSHSEETKKKMRAAKLGKYCGENSPNFGIKRSDEFKKKISIATKGRKTPIEIRNKISKSLKNTLFIMGKNGTSINVYDINGNFIKNFESEGIASDELHVDGRSVYGVLNGTRKSAGGYIFKYAI